MSKQRKPEVIAWIDVDDILVDFKRAFATHINRTFGKKLPRGYTAKTLDYGEVLTRQQFEFALNSMGDEWPEDMPVFKASAAFIRGLRKAGARVILISSVLPRSAPARVRNLLRGGIDFDEIYFTKGTEKGTLALELVRRFSKKDGKCPKSVFVDDMMRNCVEFTEKVPNSVAFTLCYPYNHSTVAELLKSGVSLPIFSLPDVPSLYKSVATFVKRV